MPPSRANAAETADAAAGDSGRSRCGEEEEEGDEDDDGAARAGRAFRSQFDAARDGAVITESAAIDEMRSRREGAEALGVEDDGAEQVDDGIEISFDDDVDARSFGAELADDAFGLADDALKSIENLILVALL